MPCVRTEETPRQGWMVFVQDFEGRGKGGVAGWYRVSDEEGIKETFTYNITLVSIFYYSREVN